MNQDGVRQGYDVKQLQSRAREQQRCRLLHRAVQARPSIFRMCLNRLMWTVHSPASVFHKQIIEIGELKQYLAGSGHRDTTMTTANIDFLTELEQVIRSRRTATGDKSYTKTLFDRGTPFIAQKVGEEAVELA